MDGNQQKGEKIMNKKIALLSQIVFFGAIWGILEATLGYALHFLPTLVAGVVMFPIASFILVRAYLKTNSRVALLFVGLLAAAIKALNFLMPYTYVIKIADPMICIVIETVVIFAIVPLLNRNKVATNLLAFPIASITWRMVFVLFLIFQDLVFHTVSGQLQSFETGMTFIVVNGLFEGALGAVVYHVNLMIGKKPIHNLTTKPIFAGVFLILAIIVTLFL